MKFEAAQKTPARRVSKRGRVGEGRPTKATPEVWQTICDLMVLGIPDEEVCEFVGVARQNFDKWKKLPEFRAESTRARVSRALGWLKRIESEPVGWQRFKWLLQSRFPTWFGAPDGETTVTLNQQINNNTLVTDSTQLERVRRILDETEERERTRMEDKSRSSPPRELIASSIEQAQTASRQTAVVTDDHKRVASPVSQAQPQTTSHVRQRDRKPLAGPPSTRQRLGI